MFINKFIARIKYKSTYLENELPRATSYVAATFHPTIGQLCSSISQHNFDPRAGNDFHKEKGNNRLTHSQIHTKFQPCQSIIGFIMMLRKWKGRISKLVSSITELRTPP